MKNPDSHSDAASDSTIDGETVTTRRYWQVMHGGSASQAENLGLLWSPKTKQNGARNPWYDTMTKAQVGDVVYSYIGGLVRAVGHVTHSVVTAPSPFVGDESKPEGWLLEVQFRKLKNPFKPTDHYEQLNLVMTEMDHKSVHAPGATAVMGYLKQISEELSKAYEELADFSSQNAEDQYVNNESWKHVDKFIDLSQSLFLHAKFLAEISELLEDKRQVIFYGPPGTGKTYVALKLAEALSNESEDSESVEIVQFHPSYAYEDFVEGFRPTENGSFVLKEGKLLSIARRAIENPGQKFFLIIDEINRGNIAKIFGEMYFLLEYRDRNIQLQYSNSEFKMPKNLYFIGTMNSADRSIGLIDTALRRRFHFVSFYPTQDEMKDVLRDWLDKNAPEVRWVADLVDNANRMLNNPDFAIGPSHFMKPNLDEALVRKIWRRSIIPYVEDVFFNRKDEVSKYELDRVRTLKRLAPEIDAKEFEEDDNAASA
jgi:MoxR-like ATPase